MPCPNPYSERDLNAVMEERRILNADLMGDALTAVLYEINAQSKAKALCSQGGSSDLQLRVALIHC